MGDETRDDASEVERIRAFRDSGHVPGALPCPFCGCAETEGCNTNPRAWWVRCAGCGADAESGRAPAEGLAHWNRRAPATTDAREVERIRAEVAQTPKGSVRGALMSTYEHVWRERCATLLARIATLTADRDALAARLPSPAAVRAARVKAAEATEEYVGLARAYPSYYLSAADGSSERRVANRCAAHLRDLARTYLGRHDEGGGVDATTLAMIALDVDGLATLGELEEKARELREVE